MNETPTAPEPDALEIFDDAAQSDHLVCRVCGALVPRNGEYPRVHWDWHEATPGA
jgi:hypothetical protein